MSRTASSRRVSPEKLLPWPGVTWDRSGGGTVRGEPFWWLLEPTESRTRVWTAAPWEPHNP